MYLRAYAMYFPCIRNVFARIRNVFPAHTQCILPCIRNVFSVHAGCIFVHTQCISPCIRNVFFVHARCVFVHARCIFACIQRGLRCIRARMQRAFIARARRAYATQGALVCGAVRARVQLKSGYIVAIAVLHHRNCGPIPSQLRHIPSKQRRIPSQLRRVPSQLH